MVWAGEGEGEDAAGGGGGAARGSATLVTAWHRAHRIDLAPGGSCKGTRQLEQFTSMLYMPACLPACRLYFVNHKMEMEMEIQRDN